jgi:hypothetical protein
VSQVGNLRRYLPVNGALDFKDCFSNIAWLSVLMPEEEENQGLQRTTYQLRSVGVPPETQNKLRTGIHSRGYLPHVKVENAS